MTEVEEQKGRIPSRLAGVVAVALALQIAVPFRLGGIGQVQKRCGQLRRLADRDLALDLDDTGAQHFSIHDIERGARLPARKTLR